MFGQLAVTTNAAWFGCDPARLVHETRRFGEAHDLVILGSEDRDLVAAHYAQLDARSLYLRFAAPVSAQAVSKFVQGTDFARDIHLGIMKSGELVGLAQLGWTHTEPDTLELGVSVVPRWQGQGLGRRLLDAAVSMARACGYRRLRLTTLTCNTPMVTMVRKLGGRTVRDGSELLTTVELDATAH